MGFWGLATGESDDGLDMLSMIASQQLKKTDFTTINVTQAIELPQQDILEIIKKNKSRMSAKGIGVLY